MYLTRLRKRSMFAIDSNSPLLASSLYARALGGLLRSIIAIFTLAFLTPLAFSQHSPNKYSTVILPEVDF